MKWKKYFFREMEKEALLGGLIMGGVNIGASAMEASSQIKQYKQKAQLGAPMASNPATSQFKLQSPNAYQFEGGKHTNFKSVMPNQFPLYS